jgi:hypothetical protein
MKGSELIEAKEKIFAEYVKASDKYATKNNLGKWAEYFPSILDFGKIEVSEKKTTPPE